MSDQERKRKSSKRDEEEETSTSEEASSEEASDEEASDEEASDEERSDEEASDEERSDEEASSDEERSDEERSDEEAADEASDEEASDEEASDEEPSEDEPSDEAAGPEGDEGEENVRAQRVAAALGVGSEQGDGEGSTVPAGDADPAAAPNRAARRAEAALRRKKRKTAGATAARSADDDAADEALPKDKNARAKELLKRRREQASGDGGTRPIQLLPGEMVDDALARSSSAVSKWIRDNFGIIQWVILAALAGGAGFLFYQTRVDKTAASATAALMTGVNADRGRVMAEDKRTDEEKEAEPLKVFKTSDERADAALAGYKKVLKEHGGSGAAILARLGEAGDYLDKRDWDHALEGFSAVASSSLAGADPDVKARALEGLGFAKEGKGDLDGALATFKEIEGIDARGFKELGLYHQGRVWLAKGDKDKAKDFLKQAHDKLEQPTTEQQSLRYLQQMTDETLRRIDPSLVPTKAPAIGGPKGGAMSGDELEKLKRRLEEAMQKKGDQH